jgi:hypothetical protein
VIDSSHCCVVDRMARPKGSSKYGAEIVEHICAEIAVAKSMREICRAADAGHADGLPMAGHAQ